VGPRPIIAVGPRPIIAVGPRPIIAVGPRPIIAWGPLHFARAEGPRRGAGALTCRADPALRPCDRRLQRPQTVARLLTPPPRGPSTRATFRYLPLALARLGGGRAQQGSSNSNSNSNSNSLTNTGPNSNSNSLTNTGPTSTSNSNSKLTSPGARGRGGARAPNSLKRPSFRHHPLVGLEVLDSGRST
jgi:hypothetical protein